MKVLLDTNICIYLIKQELYEVRTRFEDLVFGDAGVSSITVAELQFGVHKSRYRDGYFDCRACLESGCDTGYQQRA